MTEHDSTHAPATTERSHTIAATNSLARQMSNTLARLAWLPIIGTRLSAASNILWAMAARLERAERDEAAADHEASQMRGELREALDWLESTRKLSAARQADIELRDSIIANQMEQQHQQSESIAALRCLLDIERERNARLALQLEQRRTS